MTDELEPGDSLDRVVNITAPAGADPAGARPARRRAAAPAAHDSRRSRNRRGVARRLDRRRPAAPSVGNLRHLRDHRPVGAIDRPRRRLHRLAIGSRPAEAQRRRTLAGDGQVAPRAIPVRVSCGSRSMARRFPGCQRSRRLWPANFGPYGGGELTSTSITVRLPVAVAALRARCRCWRRILGLPSGFPNRLRRDSPPPSTAPITRGCPPNRSCSGHSKVRPRERSEDQIVAALSRLRGALRTARATLGPAAPSAELTTAAAALQAGVPEPRLAELHQLRGGMPVTAPLGAYLDLIARGAKADRAWSRISDLARRRAS